MTVTDTLIPALVGQAGCHYESPPQDEQQARTLIRVLLSSPRTPAGAGPGSTPWPAGAATSPCSPGTRASGSAAYASIGRARYRPSPWTSAS